MKRSKPTETTLGVLRFAVAHSLREGRFPTIREICDEFGWTSTATGHKYFENLVKFRFVRNDGRYNRSITTAGYEAAKSGAVVDVATYITSLVKGLDRDDILRVSQHIAELAS